MTGPPVTGWRWTAAPTDPPGSKWSSSSTTPCSWGADGKHFTRSRHLTRGQYLAFKYDGDETLSVKIFRVIGGREDYCVERDSSSRSSCHDEEDEDEDGENSLSVKAERSPLP